MLSKLLDMYSDSDGKVRDETVIMKAVAISYAGSFLANKLVLGLTSLIVQPEGTRCAFSGLGS